MRPGTWLGGLNCAVEGILGAVRSQRNMRAHLLAAVLVVAAGWLVGATPAELGVLFLAIGVVLATEAMNSAVEAVVDLLSPGFAEKARQAKDMAAGAVLLAAFAAAFAGVAVFYPHLKRAIAGGVEAAAGAPLAVGMVALGVTLVATVLLKARSGKGTPLHGGMPSGHSAVAFAAWGVLSLVTRHPLVILLVLLLAAMVSHSRMLMGIHTLSEVLVGAALGASVSLLVYRLFVMLGG